MQERVFNCDRNEIPMILDHIRESLGKRKISSKESAKAILAAEEVLEKIFENREEGSGVSIGIRRGLGSTHIRYTGKGDPFTIADIKKRLLIGDGEAPAEEGEANEALLHLMEKIFGRSLTVRCDKGKIYVMQQVTTSPYANLIITLLALFLGILTGLLLQNFAPENVTDFAVKNIFSPVYTLLINALKMIVAPLVFFSIASSIAEFSDIRALGRIAVKVALMYILTSVLAIFVGYGTYMLMPIGDPQLAAAVSAEAASETVAKGADAAVSIKDTLVGIVPTDIITPFQKSNMLQIIFIAVTLGLSCAALSRKYPMAKEFVATMNAAFSKLTAGIVSFLPIMIFCSMAKMMANMHLSSFMDVIVWLPVVYIGDILMICVYLVILLVAARLNPFKFLGKYYPAMISAFTLSSSNAALPSSINQCKKLGISEKVYSFSLPLGATINMDGSCITLMITSLFFAKIYGLPVTAAMLMQLFVSIIVLSVGSPGVPGGNLVCLTLLIPQIGVPAEAISIVMGLYPIVSMMQTMANVTGDAVVTTVAAKSENMLDEKVFNG